MHIPKTIFQSWTNQVHWPDNPPFPIEKQVETWKTQNPGFDYRFFSDEDCFDFVKTNYPEIFPVYERIPPIKRADLWRYLATYHYGGIYADIDCICIRPIADLIRVNDHFISGLEYEEHERRRGRAVCEYTNWVVISEPGHPILAQMIEATVVNLTEEQDVDYKMMTYGEWKLNVLSTTGPIQWSRIIDSHKNDPDVRLGPKDWFAIGESINKSIKALSPEEQHAVWRQAIDRYSSAPGPNTGDPVYILHTYLGSWKEWKRKPTTIGGKLRKRVGRIFK